MKKYILLLLLASYGFNSFAQLNKEQETIKKTFFEFLKFYQKNETKFNQFRLYKGTGKENNHAGIGKEPCRPVSELR